MEKQQMIDTLNKQIKDGTLEATISGEQIWEYAFMLTQYEKYGEVGETELQELMISREYFDDDEVSLYDWNEYCDENRYYDMHVEYLDEDYFKTYYYNDPYKAVQDVINGDVNLADKYIRCTDCWGLESLDDYTELFDSDFRKWYVEQDECNMPQIEEIKENADIIISVCNSLVKAGY